MLRHVIFLLFVVVLSSCSKDSPDGKWDDNIKLSTKYVEFSSAQDSVIITTEGSWWWINAIMLGDSTYNYFNNDIDFESDSYTISEDSFVVEKRDSYTLSVRMEANNDNKARTLKLSLQAGDYFDDVTILQAAN
jgi:hypothetical protein